MRALPTSFGWEKRGRTFTLPHLTSPPLPQDIPHQPQLTVDGAPNLAYSGTTTPVHVNFLDGEAPRLLEMWRDTGNVFAIWAPSATAYNAATAYIATDIVISANVYYICIAATTGNAPPNATFWRALTGTATFFTARDPLTGVDGNWGTSQSHWGFQTGEHILYTKATYDDATAITLSVTVQVSDAVPAPPPPPPPPPPAPPPTPTVLRVETVATDGRSGDRDNGWGGHQVRQISPVSHDDGSERLLYIRGGLNDSTRNWRLMKRGSGVNGTWAQEATGQTNGDAMVVRTSDNKVHVVSTPGWVYTIASSPNFTASTIPSLPTQDIAYNGVGIGIDGDLVVKHYFDPGTPDVTYDIDLRYQHATWNGSTWSWTGQVIKTDLGPRYAYDYVIPGSAASATFWLGQLQNPKKGAVGITTTSGTFIWDGLQTAKSGFTSAAGYIEYEVTPQRSVQGDTVAVFMFEEDVFRDSTGRIWTTYRVSSDQANNGRFLKVMNGADGSTLYHALTSYQGGNMRIIEDEQNRMWALTFQINGANPIVRMYLINADFTLGTLYDLSSSFAGKTYEGAGPHKIACPRAGCAINGYIYGNYANGSTMYAYAIQLPA